MSFLFFNSANQYWYVAVSHARLSFLSPFPSLLVVVLGLSVPTCTLLTSLSA